MSHAALAERLRKIVAELTALADAWATVKERRPQPRPRPAKRKRWQGPVPEAIRAERRKAFRWYQALCVALERDATEKYFCVLHNLNTSEMSRWLSAKPRGVQPGSATDTSIWRSLRADIARLEREAKRQGSVEIPNSWQQFRAIM